LGACAFAMHVGTNHILLVVPDLETQNSSRTSLTLPSSSPRTGPPSRSPTPPRLLATPVCSSLDHLPHHVHTPFRCLACGFTSPACGFTTPHVLHAASCCMLWDSAEPLFAPMLLLPRHSRQHCEEINHKYLSQARPGTTAPLPPTPSALATRTTTTLGLARSAPTRPTAPLSARAPLAPSAPANLLVFAETG
jgi:hypothetical protein